MNTQPVRKRGKFPLRIVGLTAAGVLVMFAIGYLVAVRVLFPPLPEPENGIVVPSLTGLTVPAAEARLRQLDLRVTDVVQLAHPSRPRGVIIAQSPLAGQQLRTAGAVRLAISAGKPRVAVPNVIGFTLERATSVLASIGFQVEPREEQSDQPAG
ncbi:MAG TPA: PASTA domain-containing protein, partial [Longimicrobiales bacterium]